MLWLMISRFYVHNLRKGAFLANTEKLVLNMLR